MNIVADENIPFAREAFGLLGNVNTLPGRLISPSDLKNADMLIVRSVTKVNAELLQGTPVRFVGTATIGTDHIDEAWLTERGIGFAAAPGSNAESVAQYIGAALAFASLRLERPLSECSLGVIGVGNCGRRVARIAKALGMRVVLNDPPLARASGDPQFRQLEEALVCDYISLHVPLTRNDPDPTWHLLDSKVLERMQSGAVIINASRGHVIDEAVALDKLKAGLSGGIILDAWENEPWIERETLARALLATPHIAGYSLDGKVSGTRMIYEAACHWFDIQPQTIQFAMPPPSIAELTLDAVGRGLDSVLAEAMLTAYPIYRDDGDLRRVIHQAKTAQQVGTAFDECRKKYPLRREFSATHLILKNAPVDWADRFRALGFTVADVFARRQA